MEPSPFIPITSDYGFKVTFGNTADTLFLRVALQALIDSPVPIREVQFDKTTFEALTRESRAGIYDVACTDERGNQFIVEMQLAHAPGFVQRMKFYALHKLNTLVERGDFDYLHLPRLYCIAILDRSILPGSHYRTVANLRTEQGELLDEQLTFILVELAKFDLPLAAVQTDLHKLLYTMKTLHTTPPASDQYPRFWNEEWLRRAVHELNTRNMTPEDRAAFARAVALKAEDVNIDRRRVEKLSQRSQRGVLSPAEIAEDLEVSLEFVLNVQERMRQRGDTPANWL